MKYLRFILLYSTIAVFLPLSLKGQSTILDEVEIWPGVGPGSDTLTITENVIVRSLSGTCDRDNAIEKITVPTLTPLVPDEPNGTAFIICPGGAYQRVVYDVEGIDIGEWLNSIGVTAFVLKYRLPNDEHIDKKNVPLQDAQRAVRYVKMNADTWGLDTNKIGIAGFSAGGHVASTLATSFDKLVYEPRDSTDSLSARPYYMFLIYPVVSMETDITHIGSRDLLLGSNPDQELIDEFSAEKKVTSETPKSFLGHALDDSGVSPQNSIRLYEALVDSGVPGTLVLFGNGGHGKGICKTGDSELSRWPDHCTNWLYSEGLTDVYVEIDTAEVPEDLNPELKTSDGLKIYPNPNDGTFDIVVNADEVISTGFIIRNCLGQEVYAGKIRKENDISVYKAEVCILTPGIYYFTLKTRQGVLAHPFLVRQ